MAKPVVLVVDDNRLIIDIILSMLGDKYDLRIARNGKECLSRSLIKPYPDIILLDIVMPVLDGFETIKLLKKNEVTRNIPVIFLTALSREDELIKGFQLGAVDYLTKPLQVTELLARLKMHLELKFSRERIERQKEDLEKLNAILEDKLLEQREYIAKAKILQDNLIQKDLPLLNEFTIQALYLPCEALGGDFFSIVKGLHEKKLVVILGDCTGHGIQASIEASLLTSIVHKNMFLLLETSDPAAFLSEVNRSFIKVADEDKFPTIFVCILDFKSKQLIYSNANGVLPSLNRGQKIIHMEPVEGMHLGYSADTSYGSAVFQLEEGDRIFFYSDAVLEYDAVKFNHSGLEKFEELLIRNTNCPTVDFNTVISELKKLSGGLPLADDTTLIQIDLLGVYDASFSFSTIEEYKKIYMKIETALYQKDYLEEEVARICIGMDEMCLNAYYHGNKQDPLRNTTIDVYISCEDLTLVITDMGEGFNPDCIQNPVENVEEIYERNNPDEYMHGRGIAIARMFYDSVKYNAKGNSVALYKRKEENPVYIL